jgi:hypothetical protein
MEHRTSGARAKRMLDDNQDDMRTAPERLSMIPYQRCFSLCTSLQQTSLSSAISTLRLFLTSLYSMIDQCMQTAVRICMWIREDSTTRRNAEMMWRGQSGVDVSLGALAAESSLSQVGCLTNLCMEWCHVAADYCTRRETAERLVPVVMPFAC